MISAVTEEAWRQRRHHEWPTQSPHRSVRCRHGVFGSLDRKGTGAKPTLRFLGRMGNDAAAPLVVISRPVEPMAIAEVQVVLFRFHSALIPATKISGLQLNQRDSYRIA